VADALIMQAKEFLRCSWLKNAMERADLEVSHYKTAYGPGRVRVVKLMSTGGRLRPRSVGCSRTSL
jgi:hypothetical protein